MVGKALSYASMTAGTEAYRLPGPISNLRKSQALSIRNRSKQMNIPSFNDCITRVLCLKRQ